jgi:hypothetical protein
VATRAEYEFDNAVFLEGISSGGMTKKAEDLVNGYTRIVIREDGFFRKILPMVPIADDELTQVLDDDNPSKIVEREPGSRAAISIAFGGLPENVVIHGSKYRIAFNRIMTPRMTKDVAQLRTYIQDIRQIISNNAIKDIATEEDSKFISVTNTALVGADTVMPWSNIAQWRTISGGIDRDSIQEADTTLKRTFAHLSPQTALCNNVTIHQFMKFDRNEMGGDFSEDVLRKGWTETEFMNKKWIVTIKRDLVPDDSIYYFADPKFMGKSFEYEPPTMYVKKEAYHLEFFCYESIGAGYGHTAGFARVDFN